MARTKKNNKMILITVHLTEQQVKLLDKLVEMNVFPNRSEAIREAVRRLIDFYLYSSNQEFKGLVVGL